MSGVRAAQTPGRSRARDFGCGTYSIKKAFSSFDRALDREKGQCSGVVLTPSLAGWLGSSNRSDGGGQLSEAVAGVPVAGRDAPQISREKKTTLTRDKTGLPFFLSLLNRVDSYHFVVHKGDGCLPVFMG